MEAQHTKGKWEAHDNLTSSTVFVPEMGGYKVIATCTSDHNMMNDNEIKANAKLIAASPDMLLALQKAVEVIERLSDEYSAIAGHHASYTNGEARIIEGAIRKATL